MEIKTNYLWVISVTQVIIYLIVLGIKYGWAVLNKVAFALFAVAVGPCYDL